MTGAACDVNNYMIDEGFHKSWINCNPALDLLSLLAIAEVLSPLVNSTFLSQAKSMISTAFNLCHV